MVANLKTPSIEGYVIRHISVNCPECSCSFSTSSLVEIPAVTEYDTVEADLHRVLPDPELRGALISICPHCNYATWTVKFKGSSLNPEMLPDSIQLAHSKKFALAVKHAREKGISPLDIAFIALNGLYCARESGEETDLWLELAAYEQNRGINEESLIPPTGQDHLIMAELWRQLSSYENAIQHYAKAIEEYEKSKDEEFFPRELIEQQFMLCRSGNTSPTNLSPYMVREMFPQAAELTNLVPVGKNGRPVPPIIERRPKPEKLEMVNFGPPERREPLSSAVKNEPIVEEERVVIELGVPASPAPVEAPPPVELPRSQETGTATNVSTVGAHADSIPVAKVRQIIAQPAGGSAIYLVQAAQVPQIGGASNGNGNGKGPVRGKGRTGKAGSKPADDPLPPMDVPTNEYFAGASSPGGTASGAARKERDKSPTQRALNKAMKKEEEEVDRFPEIQLTDEYADEQYYATYDNSYAQQAQSEDFELTDYEEAERQAQMKQQQQAAQQQQAQGGSNDHTSAINQVESFLSLTRQSSYQNWVRSYRR